MDEAERIPSRDEFKVAIICAVGKEGEAVEKLFDKTWKTNELGRDPGDLNAYTVGKIGTAFVVVVWLAEYGKTKAATAATHLRYSFNKIQHALVVGICGGVPSPGGTREIVLGDVVISTELQQYDQGKQYPMGYRTNAMTRPRKDMGAFLRKLSASGESRKTLKDYSAVHLQRMFARDTEYAAKARYPGPDEDILYSPTHIHKHYLPSHCHVCSDASWVCDKAKDIACSDLHCGIPGCDNVIARSQRQTLSAAMSPSVHFGTVGSGDTVMKSAEHRDLIAEREEIIAFEMEGAGVYEEIESIVVIKGVCDYADSHKNKKWQNYAAAVAAACTGAFLEMKEEDFGCSGPVRKNSASSVATTESFMSSTSMFTTEPHVSRQTSWGNGVPMSPPLRSPSGPISGSTTSSSQSFPARPRTISTVSDPSLTAWPGRGPSWNGFDPRSEMGFAHMSLTDISTPESPSGGIAVQGYTPLYQPHPQHFMPSPLPSNVGTAPSSPVSHFTLSPSSTPVSQNVNNNSKPADEAARLLLDACNQPNGLSAAYKLRNDTTFDVNARNSKGKTVAHLVLGTANVTSNRKKMMLSATAIYFLCQQHANLTLPDDSGMTPLHWCVKTANIAATRHLLAHHVEVNPVDSSGRTPLYLLGIDGSPVLDMAKLLIHAGGHLNGKVLPPLSGRPKEVQHTVRNLLKPCT
ncbi:purine and uridine phosphorylase [Melanomma pulvis-pyrius CBS 109.77]|uniref:Purine and uridine phosphorylase n=1 Tax=Melanomma pulvis-pyrius CBS 109.77 TaxID=1314802 RepID=A0A6A6X9J5_9PLEO|nr:purine and uridine phosphorylase [Melanomma pulvis-pyrius CBS 109.77]